MRTVNPLQGVSLKYDFSYGNHNLDLMLPNSSIYDMKYNVRCGIDLWSQIKTKINIDNIIYMEVEEFGIEDFFSLQCKNLIYLTAFRIRVTDNSSNYAISISLPSFFGGIGKEH